jgi:hypothetical protein
MLFHGNIGNANAPQCYVCSYLASLVMETDYVRCMVRTGSVNTIQINHLKTEIVKYCTIQFSPMSERALCLEGSEASLVCPGKRNVYGALVEWYCQEPVGHWWNGTGRNMWGIGGMVLAGTYGALVEWYWQEPMGHWWNGTGRNLWGIGGMVLAGTYEALVEWYWQEPMGHWWNGTGRNLTCIVAEVQSPTAL